MTDLRPPGEPYEITAGQPWWLEATVEHPLTDHDLTRDVTAVVWRSWSDRTPVDGVAVEIRATADQLAAGAFHFGQQVAPAESFVFYLAVAEKPEQPPEALAGIEMNVLSSGRRR